MRIPFCWEIFLAGGVSAVVRIPQQDSANRAFNKLARTFAAQVETVDEIIPPDMETLRDRLRIVAAIAIGFAVTIGISGSYANGPVATAMTALFRT
jgi:hypothetical protein